MAEIRRTFIPQFTVRWILLFTAAMAVVSLIIARALQGDAWAAGITTGLVTLAVSFFVYAAMFGAVSLFGQFVKTIQTRRNARSEKENNSTPPTDSIVKTASSTSIRGSSGIHGLFLVLMWSAVALHGGATWAASGGSMTLPQLQPGEVNRTGLALSIDTAWVDSCGYRPVRISVKSLTGLVKADRVLTVTFCPMQGYTRNESVAVTQSIEIPAGSTSVAATLSVPQLSVWGMFTLDVYEDGEYLKQLSVPENMGWTSWSGTAKGDGASPVILLLSGMDKISGSFLINPSMELIGVAPKNSVGIVDPQIAAAAATAGLATGGVNVGFAAKFAIAAWGDLPTRWIDYSGIDVMLISMDKLGVLTQQQLSQWKAINDWLHNGGNLIVYDAGKRWNQLADLERAVQLHDSTVPAEASPVERGWELPRESLRKSSDTNLAGASDVDRKTSDLTPADQAPFMSRRCALGMAVVIPSEESISDKNYPWTWLFSTVGPQRWQWSQRWGVSLYQPNNDYWNFLIPGVGLVPVTQFQVLITLFVVLLGPVNYYLLRHWGKLNLTVLTVPAGALLVTGALLLYALIEDGLSVRLRAKSFTHIDQRSGDATCWTRLSFYAGLAPSGGLKFAGDTAVIPLEAQAMSSEEEPNRKVDWEPTEASNLGGPVDQKLTGGWLYSRTPTQFITARIRKCTERVEIQSDAKGVPPWVVNRLGTHVKQLLLVDENGKCFTAADLAPDAKTTTKVAESQSAAFQEMAPLLQMDGSGPVVVPTNHKAPGFFGFLRQQRDNAYRRPATTYIPPDNPGGSINAGMLERSLAEVQRQLADNSLPPRTYVAVVDLSPEVQFGTSAAKPEESLHVIVGQW